MESTIIASVITFTFLCPVQISTSHAKESESSSSVVERLTDMRVPPNDDRLYRGLRLRNGMQILLVSDPSTKKSAACMSVGVGAMYDFRDVPGLANLVGLMLLQGSKRYPTMHGFKTFVHGHSGNLSIITNRNEQHYSFDIKATRLIQALHRFAHFFLEPLLSYSNDVDIDDALAVTEDIYYQLIFNDATRITEVEKSMSKRNSPYYHLYNGNKETLFYHARNLPPALPGEPDPKKVSLCEKVRKFHSMWYSSNIMTLAVLGKESLDKLEEHIVPLFEKVVNKNVKQMVYGYEHHPWGPEQLKHKIHIVPLQNLTILRINFPTPDTHCCYKTSPGGYVTYLLRSERPGSVSYTLRKAGLCNDLNTETTSSLGIQFFTITCNLTDSGLTNADYVIFLIFQYIHLIRTEGVQEHFFKELSMLHDIALYNYIPPKDAHATVNFLATTMQSYPLEDVLTYNFVRTEWKPSIIHDFLSYLRPDNTNISITSKSSASLVNKVEYNFKAVYGVEDLSEDLIEMWNTKQQVGFELPPANEYIPENFEVYPVGEDKPTYPYIIHESSISEVWFKQEREFRIPALHVHFEIYSLSSSTPFDRSLWRLFDAFLLTSLKGHIFPALQAQYKWNVKTNDDGLRITISGYSNKLPLLLERLLSKMTNLAEEFNEINFNDSLASYTQIMKDNMNRSHSFQVDWFTQYLLNDGGWAVHSIFTVLKTLRYDDMKKFLSKRLFRRIFIRGLIHGNCTKGKAMDIVNILEKSFSRSNGMLLQELILRTRIAGLNYGSHFVYRTFNKTLNGVYGYSAAFQVSTIPTTLNNIASKLLFEIISKSCNDIVSDKGKNSEPEIRCSMQGLRGTRRFIIKVTMARIDPRRIDAKVDTFLHNTCDVLRSTDQFESWKEELELSAYSRPLNFVTLSEYYWLEIANQHYQFNRIAVERDQLRSLKREQVLVLCKEMLDKTSSRRRKLAVHVLPTGAEDPRVNGSIKITDPDEFKTSLTLLPLTHDSSLSET